VKRLKAKIILIPTILFIAAGTSSAFIGLPSIISDRAQDMDEKVKDAALSVSIINPSDTENVSGTVDIEADVKSVTEIKKVEFYIDGYSLNYIDTEPPYIYSWETPITGFYTIKVKAYDEDGRTASDRISVSIGPVSVSITNPSDGEIVYGAVDITTDVESDAEIDKVVFYINDVVKNTATSYPYSHSWDTTALSTGSYKIKVKAYDAHEHTATDQIKVSINPVSVTITNPWDGKAITSPSVDITADIQASAGIEKVKYYINDSLYSTKTSAPYTYTWNTKEESKGFYTIKTEVYDADGRTAYDNVSVNIGYIYASGPAHEEGGIAFRGAARGDDERIIFAPANSENIGIFNPSDDSYMSAATHGQGDYAFRGAARANDGRIIFAPSNSPYVGIFDLSDDSYTDGPSTGEDNAKFSGAVRAQDGRIIFVPYFSDIVGIFNPSGDSYTSGPEHNEGHLAFQGAAKTDDGRIILAPYESDNIGIFDPSDNSYTSGPAHDEGDQAFHGAVRADDGRIIFAPYQSKHVGIFKPSDNSYKRGPAHGQGEQAFRGAVIDEEGVIIFAPADSDNVGIFDPSDNSYTSGPEHKEGTRAFEGAVRDKKGRCIFAPSGSDNIGTYK